MMLPIFVRANTQSTCISRGGGRLMSLAAKPRATVMTKENSLTSLSNSFLFFEM